MIALTRRKVVFRWVLEPNLLWGALRPMRRLLALLLVLPWKFRQLCSIIVLSFGKLATIHYDFVFQVQLVMVHVFRRLAMCQRRLRWGAREGEGRPSSPIVLFRCRVRSRVQLISGTTSGAEWWWSRPLTMVLLISNEDTLGLIPCGFLICWIV